MMEIKFTPSTKKVLAIIEDLPKEFESGCYEALQDIGSEFVREEVRLEKRRDKTGRLYGGIRASAPGEVPQRRTGRLSNSTDSKVHSPVYMSFGQSVDYAKYLSDGIRGRLGPRANLTKAVANKIGLAGELIKQHVNSRSGLDNA